LRRGVDAPKEVFMSDPGSPARRPGVARPFIITLLGVSVVAGGAWVAMRQMGGAAPDAPPPVTATAVSRPQPTPMPAAQEAVANAGNAPTLSLDGPASAGATDGGPAAAPPDKAPAVRSGPEPAPRTDTVAAEKSARAEAPHGDMPHAATPHAESGAIAGAGSGASAPPAGRRSATTLTTVATADAPRETGAPPHAESGAIADAGSSASAPPASRRSATTLTTVATADAPRAAGDTSHGDAPHADTPHTDAGAVADAGTSASASPASRRSATTLTTVATADAPRDTGDTPHADSPHADAGAVGDAGISASARPPGRRAATTPTTVATAHAPRETGDVAPPPQEAGSGAPKRPSFDIVRVTPHGETVVAGRASPNTEVALLDNGRPIAHAQADPSGQFVLLPDKPLPAGGQELSLQSQAPGEKPVAGDAPAILVVPEATPAGRSDHAAPGSAPPSQGALAVLTPPEGAPVVLQAPEGEKPSPAGQVALTAVDYDEHGGIRFAGTARAGGKVRLYVDNVAIGDAAVDHNGRWSLLPGTAAVGGGPHRLRADEMGARGQVLSRVELPFERATFAAADLHAGKVIVQPRQSLWRIARMVYGRGVHYTVIYAANRDQIRDPNLIYPGQLFSLPANPELAGTNPPPRAAQ
jgi:nucleoid-associated protein YgaU